MASPPPAAGAAAGAAARQQREGRNHELSPLLLSQTSSGVFEDTTAAAAEEDAVRGGDRDHDRASGDGSGGGRGRRGRHHGDATVSQTVLNLMKTCMGTGCLALSYSCRQGGWPVFVAGSFLIAGWNVLCVQRLCSCLNYAKGTTSCDGGGGGDDAASCEGEDGKTFSGGDVEGTGTADPSFEGRSESEQQRPPKAGGGQQASRTPLSQPPPQGISTLGRVAWYAYGRRGLQASDVLMTLLLFGVIVSYVSAAVSFLGDTPFTLGPVFDAAAVSLVCASVSLVPHLGYLSKASALGLAVLFATIVVIAGYGLAGLRREEEEEQERMWLQGEDGGGARIHSPMAMVDETIGGEVPVIPFWPESLSGVSQWFGVIVFGFGVVPLTYNYRESMSEPQRMVGATAAALTAVSCLYIVIGIGLLALFPHLDGDVLHELPRQGVLPVLTRLAMVWVILTTAPLLIVPCGELLEGRLRMNASRRQRAMVRFTIAAICAAIAVLVPGFVKVLSLVGSACVGTVSLILPPLLHLKLTSLAAAEDANYSDEDGDDDNDNHSHSVAPRRALSASRWTDRCLLAAGIAATVISTYLSL